MEGSHILLSITLLCIIFYTYLTYSSYDVKIKSILISFLYSVTEFTWIGSTIQLPNGEIIFKPFDKRCRKPHTVNFNLIEDNCPIYRKCTLSSISL